MYIKWGALSPALDNLCIELFHILPDNRNESDKVISTDVMECLEEEKELVRMNLAPISETAEPYIMAPFVYLTMSAHTSNLILLPGE